ncbi:MAG: U32 family peptidase [Lachnospiraceae bacterium]|nr:U32 family peptidase [Lachnospiraceae bacterium]
MRKKPELLCPAGSLEVLRVAVDYGADAVYIGGDAFGLRAKAHNFSMEEMAEGIEYAHAHGAAVHVTANILAHEKDMKDAAGYFRELAEVKPDAILIADPGMFMLAKEHCPGIPIHISTQANNTNAGTFRFWHDLGAARVVCARELSLEEIRQIRENTPEDLEIEAFIHGAMCISYSGRCLLSAYFTGRNANLGECTHPCRWKYAVMEESRPGQYLPVYENERGTFVFNSQDLCMIEHIPELAGAGIDSFKIEGRMKTALYVATVARTYRRAIDDFFESEELYRSRMDWYHEEIRRCTYRGFSTGFYFGKPGAEAMIYENSTYLSEAVYLGRVQRVTSDVPAAEDADRAPAAAENADIAGKAPSETAAYAVIEQKNKFSVGDTIEIMKRDGSNISAVVKEIVNEDGERQESAPHARQILYVRLDSVVPEAGDLLRAIPEKEGHQ